MQYVDLVLKHHNLPRSLVQRVVAYHGYQNKYSDTFDQHLLSELPEGLQVRSVMKLS